MPSRFFGADQPVGDHFGDEGDYNKITTAHGICPLVYGEYHVMAIKLEIEGLVRRVI
ncbi:hypothetical protein ACFL3A_00455 [Pseudomonadota bacterium]